MKTLPTHETTDKKNITNKSRIALVDLKALGTLDNVETCVSCGDEFHYVAESLARRYGKPTVAVVCNIYDGERWTKREVWHTGCYEEARVALDAIEGEVIDSVRTRIEDIQPEVA